jgi:uncharacterized zinc-type alcohol dehydrogenase-like protein
MKVKAFAAKSAKAALEPFEYETGPLGPHEVEIKVSHCGVCHSDICMIDNDWGISSYPIVPGHEVIGTVAAVGSDVTSPKVGTRVGLGWQRGSCGECGWCRRGKQQLCPSERDTVVAHHGGFAELVRCDANFAIPIPDALDSAVAGPLMCAGGTVFSPLIHNGVNGTMRTAVAGIGGLGHLAIQYLAAMGCDVTAISGTHSKEAEARKLGASHFIATADPGAMAKAAGSFDFILSTISADADWAGFLAALRPEGKLVIVGVPQSDIKVPAFPLIIGEKSVIGGRLGSPADNAAMLKFTARHGVKPMVEGFALRDVNKALDHVRSGKVRYRAVLAV